MTERFLPEKIVSIFGRGTDKKLWRLCDRMHAERSRKDDCFFVHGMDFIGEAAKSGFFRMLDSESDVARIGMLMHAAASWRPTQDIVRFDDVLYDSLTSAEFRRAVPGDILRRLPAWSVYIETPRGFGKDGYVFPGFFATLSSQDTMTMVMTAEDENLTTMNMIIPLNGDLSSDFMFLRQNDEIDVRTLGNDRESLETRRLLSASLSLVIYICSYGFGDGQAYHDGQRRIGQARKVKGEWRTFPAVRPTLRQPGAFFAEKIREGLERTFRVQSGERAPVRPHMRRAHMHRHRIGPGRSDVIMKFHLPVMCALHNAGKVGGQEM